MLGGTSRRKVAVETAPFQIVFIELEAYKSHYRRTTTFPQSVLLVARIGLAV
jgi:hypothetical protein